jgi:sugar/nucleoside kinase (ribokinase family)
MTQRYRRKGRPNRPLIVGTGLIALDAVTSADESIPVRYWTGGTCGNVLIAMSYLGWSAQPVARLAIGRSSELLLSDLRRWRVSDRFIRVEEDGSTPIIAHRIKRDATGRVEHSFSWRCTSCGSRYPGYKPELVTVAEKIAPSLKNSSVFFFDRVSAAALVLARAAAQGGALVVFEPSSIGNPILFHQAWEIAHVVKYSHERLSDFPEMDVETSPRLVIETLGDAGLRYRRKKQGERLGTWIESRAIPVDYLRDTAGSGDWCTAGLLSKVASTGYPGFAEATDRQIREAIRFGQALAAWNCQFEGARGGMYAVSRREFRGQIAGILSGAGKLIPASTGFNIDTPNASIVCRVCEHSASRSQKKRKKAN